MASYAALMRGSAGGVVIFKGDAPGSRMVEVIEEGDMPRGGLKITADEFKILKSWINEGAKFDGGNATANLAQLAPGATAEDAMKVGVTKSTGKETISFARDIAPVLVAQCSGCHVNTTRPRGDLNMTTFAQLLAGGESGAPVVPGKPADSLLIKKLKGVGGGQQMPVGKDPLPTDIIAKFEKWIAEGATFDGKNPADKTEDVANLAKAEAATHEELSADRKEIAGKNWRLGMPGIDTDTATTKNFLLVGNLGQNTLEQHGKTAEAVAPKVGQMFGAASDDPLVKGRITLFFFKQRYDYSEFGKMVEKRSSTPREWKGHWNFTIVDAYGAITASFEPDYSMEALLGQQIAGVYVASLGNSPRWFSEGAARVAAVRLAKDDPRTAKWNDELPEILRGMSDPADFINNKLAPESNDIASYSFVEFLMKDRKRFDQLLNALRGDKSFDKSFSSIYGGSPEQVAGRWRQGAGRR